MTLRLPASGLLAIVVATAAACGFHVDRERGTGDTIHPAGFADPESEEFHAPYLVTNGYPLADCRGCHGDDYGGGTVGSSCLTSGCHTEGVESCSTCHDDPPKSGSHPAHGADCTSCHPVHVDARGHDHPSGTVDFAFSGLAVQGGATPSFDPDTDSCSNVYCHGGRTIQWGTEGPLACSSCHDAPPETHARFADTQSDCATCHGASAGHVDGVAAAPTLACDSCHGKGTLGAPPDGLDGALSGGAVGAHARHLDSTLSDRIGRVAKCRDCHTVPETADAPGHIDATAPSDVDLLLGGTYDPASRSCTVSCHWDRDPGPAWDDDSGAARTCDACHGFPPATTRIGVPHAPAPPDAQACAGCHSLAPATHVDGKVDLL